MPNLFFSSRTVFLLVALPCLTVAAAAQHPRATPVTQAEVDAITRDAILIDTHDDIPSKTIDGYDIATHNAHGETDLPRMRGFLGAEFFSVFVDAKYVAQHQSANRALAMIDTVRTDIIAAHPNDFLFATTSADIERAHQQHKIAALMGIEGGHAIEDSLRLLRDFYALGVRYMTLTHFNTNDWADSQGDINNPAVHHHNGLTPFGKQVVAEMNRLGMMVDISHVSDKTFYDTLAASTAPIIASHSSMRALTGFTRNMTDDMVRALAAKGGVIQINLGCSFVRGGATPGAKPDHSIKPTLADVVAHIDRAVQVGGIDHVGIGTDFDGADCSPPALDSYNKFPTLTRALLEKGYSAADIEKIYGGNTLRLMRAVEQRAAELQQQEAPLK